MIRLLTIENFGPFRGKHVVELGAGAYAIVARHEGDPRRSNAVGKSMLLEAIDYALTGRLNPNRGFDADGWISRGEREGSVRVELEDGSWIERSKKVGSPRQVRASLFGIGAAAQDAANDAFLAYLGFDEEDYRRVAYFEQKEASRLLRAAPTERLAIVSSWLGLDLADRAEERAGEIAKKRWIALEQHAGKLAIAPKPTTIEETPSDEELRKEADVYRETMKMLEEQYRKADAVREATALVARYDETVEKGKALREWIDANRTRIETDLALAEAETIALSDKIGELRRAYARADEVAKGDFDGRCPVAGIACPATETINSDRVVADSRRRRAKKELDDAKAEATAAEEKANRAKADARALAIKDAELKRLRSEAKKDGLAIDEARKLANSYADDPSTLWSRVEAINEGVIDIETKLRTRERARADAKKALEIRLELEEEGKRLETEHRVAHRTREVFRLARRRVAERALAEIEADANEAIASAGVDLRLAVRWEREGKKPAIECSECGAPFPSSARVKECPKCGAPRGQHSIPRLDFLLSDSSGGFDDLAGVALQLSAGAWLLAKRSSPWATAILDEATAALDPALRKGLVRYLGSMSARTYRQLLVVSHSSDFVDAIPNRITIVQKSSGERAIVS